MTSRLFLPKLCLLAFGLAGCATLPSPEATELVIPETFTAAADAAVSDEFPDPRWWQGFSSPGLDDLIVRAHDGSPDLAVAAARIAQAEAELRRSRAGLFPTLGLDANVSRRHQPLADGPGAAATHSVQAGLRASYEPDLWGGATASTAAVAARLDAGRFESEAAALSLTAEVALAYFDWLALGERRTATENALDLARQVLRLAETRERVGTTSGLEVAQQRAVLANLEALHADLGRLRHARSTQLAILLGENPGAFTPPPGRLGALALPVPVPGLPSELLRRRPDLRAAEAGLLAAEADIAVARAALLPSMNLTATSSLTGNSLSAVFDPATLALSVSAGLVQAVFDGGARRADVERAEARQVELLEAYRGAVLSALRDVETALHDLRAQSEIESARHEALDASREALRVAEAQFRAGAVDFLHLLDAQRGLVDAESQAVQARLARLEAAVGLYRALGGGYDRNHEAT